MEDNSKLIKIAGGGIAGLTAAIQLKNFGLNPIVYEKEPVIGGNRHGDYEGLENWIFEDSMNDFFLKSGFDFNQINSTPIHKFRVHTAKGQSFEINNKNPFFYMVKRGSNSTDLDVELSRQCIRAGVQIKLGKQAPEKIDIDATGSHKAAAYVNGVTFETSKKDQVHLLLGHDYAPKGYSYLIIINGKGTLATVFKKPTGENFNPLQNSRGYFEDYGINISFENSFGSRGSFSLPFGNMSYPYRIGEAGGFQDYLFGFGIRMSMLSGCGAALAILQQKEESRTIMRLLNKKRRISFVSRMLFERMSDDAMARAAKKFSQVSNPLSLLSRTYDWNYKTLIRWISMKNRYEVRPT